MLWWLCGAMLLFWALGAYNRLVGLRAQMTMSLLALARHWRAQAACVRTHALNVGSVAQESQWGALDAEQPLRAVLGAAKQLDACLAPLLDTPRQLIARDHIATAQAAQAVLHNVWHRLADTADDLAGSAVPPALAQQWQQYNLLAQAQRDVFNTQAQAYNDAINQFPALLIAWAFGFEASPTL